jgi:TonB family protein
MRDLMRGLVLSFGLVLGGAIAAGPVATEAVAAQAVAAQDGRIIEARDGDTVIVRENMRVRVVKRTPGIVRIAVNHVRGFVVVMLDKGSDGRADWVYRFDIDKPYPLDAPWEGAAEIDEYFEPGRPSGSYAVVTPQGVIQFLSGAPGLQDAHAVSNALAIVRTNGVRGGMVNDPFAVVEPYWLEGREDEYRSSGPMPNIRTGLSMSATTTSRRVDAPPPEGFVEPRLIHRVDALQPEIARGANVQGTVIVEVTVAVDGTVTNARVLRSIPLLNQAALRAVRQWRYEPARRNGQPIEQTTTEGVFVGPPSTPEQPRP